MYFNDFAEYWKTNHSTLTKVKTIGIIGAVFLDFKFKNTSASNDPNGFSFKFKNACASNDPTFVSVEWFVLQFSAK